MRSKTMYCRRLGWFLTLALMFFLPVRGLAADWHVSINEGSDQTGNGSRELPFASIQKAIDEAIDGDRIHVAQGVYGAIGIYDKNLTVSGGFTEVDWSQDFDSYETIIDGGDNGPCVALENSSTLFEGFIVQNGRAGDHGGGGINIHQGSSIIRNCTIRNNNAIGVDEWGGGGILSGSGEIQIHDCFVVDNYAENGASGIRIGGSNFLIKNTVVADNHGDEGVEINNSTGDMRNVTIADNSAGGFGFWQSEVSFFNSIAWSNNRNNWRDESDVTFAYSLIEGGAEGIGVSNEDPRFCDPVLHHFTLASNSPCLGAGEGGSDIGAFGQGCGDIEVIDYLINWWYVQKRKFADGRQFNVAHFAVVDKGGNYILEDAIDSIKLFAPDESEVALKVAEFGGPYKIVTGHYDAENGRWNYDDHLNEESYYRVEFDEPLQAGQYHLQATDVHGRAYDVYRDCTLNDVELPIISSASFSATFDGEGNLIWKWEPPTTIDHTINTSIRAWVRGLDSGGWSSPEIYTRVPAHMGYLFVPKHLLNLLETEEDDLKIGLHLRVNDNSYRAYSGNISLTYAKMPPVQGDVSGDRKIDLKEAIHALQVTAGVK